MEGWADLPLVIFSLIPFWDGRMVARVRATCTQWRRAVERQKHLMHMFFMHYVRVEHVAELSGEILHGYTSKRTKLKKVRQTTATNITDSILFHQHDFNGYMIYDVFKRIGSTHVTTLTGKLVTPDKFAYAFGWQGEGVGYFIEENTQDIILVNNFGTRFSGWKDASRVAGMRFLEETFQRDVTWKLIEFPKQTQERWMVSKKDFHRGGCYMVRFRNTSKMPWQGVGKQMRKSAKKKRRREPNPIERTVRNYATSNNPKKCEYDFFDDAKYYSP
jgi:hypothetical protein